LRDGGLNVKPPLLAIQATKVPIRTFATLWASRRHHARSLGPVGFAPFIAHWSVTGALIVGLLAIASGFGITRVAFTTRKADRLNRVGTISSNPLESVDSLTTCSSIARLSALLHFRYRESSDGARNQNKA